MAANTIAYAVVTTGDLASSNLSGAGNVAALSPGTLIASFLDGNERGRTFVPPLGALASQFGGAATPLVSSNTAAGVVFPAIVSATVISDSAGNPTGPLKLVLAPGTGDLTNASSVMTYLLDQEVQVTTVTGSF